MKPPTGLHHPECGIRNPGPAPRPRGVQPCPGLTVTANAGVFFTDCLARVYDLERERKLRPKEAAADPRLGPMPVREVLRLISAGELYPVVARNARVLLILDCALTDWQVRQLATRPLRHLVEVRAEHVA